MNSAANTEEHTVESEFVRTIAYLDLYLQQKTDLFLQHYVFAPVNFLLRQCIVLSIVITILVSGIISLVIGLILFIATIIPLWAALLVTGIGICGIGGIIAYKLISENVDLKTPKTIEFEKNAKS
jgi:hypothetical protein